MSREVEIKWKIPERPECFFGRDLELSQLDFLLNTDVNVVFVQGIGGIGKSDLVKKYVLDNRNKYETIIFTQYVSDLKSLIASDVEIPLENFCRNTLDNFNIESEEDYFKRKFKILKEKLTPNMLLVVDNFNNSEDEFLEDFLKLNCKIVFTSQCDWRGKHYPVLDVEEIKNIEDCKRIFYHYYIPQPEEEKIIRDIIEVVSRHTFSIEWIAKKLSEKIIKPEEICYVLKNKMLNTNERHANRENIFLKLAEVFHVERLSEEEKEILRFLCFVPYTGISKMELVQRGGKGAHSVVLKLLHNSWIRQVTLDVVTLHPVIAETVEVVLKPSWNNCKHFVEGIKNDLQDDDRSMEYIEELLVIAENMFKGLGMEDEGAVDLIQAVSYVFMERYKKYDIALGLLKKAVMVEEKYLEQLRAKMSLCKNQDAMDVAYNDIKGRIYIEEKRKCQLSRSIGLIEYQVGDYESALARFMSLSKHPMIDVYCDIARIYESVNEFQKAMQYVKAGIKMKEKQYGFGSITLIENYMLLAEINFKLQDIKVAYQWLDRAKEIAEIKMSTEEQGDFYYKYALLLKRMNRVEEALEYDQKSFMMKMRQHGVYHIEVAKAYGAMSVDYYRLGDYVSVLECTLREISIRKKINRVKVRLYLSVSRIMHFVDANQLESETQKELDAFMADFNRIVKEHPVECEEMMRQ